MSMDASWKPLFRVGAMANVAVLVLVPIQIVLYVLWPPPSTVLDWFTLFQAHGLIGLMGMDVLLIVGNVLMALIYLALYAALRGASPSLMTLAVALEFVAIATYFGSNTAFEMLSLSKQYAAAATEVQRGAILAAGHAMVTSWKQGSAFNVSYVLGAIATLLTSAAMLRSQEFGRVTAYVGLVFGVLSLVPASAGKPGIIFSLISLVPMWIWLVLIAQRLFQLGRGAALRGRAEVK
ncbi:DUF4386 family protein [Archangium minus]|uniref:DUF4386 family protein n=1 Tax=Archangium minus TaxID=83450 RepID=A0ABY9WVW5_9BACT|nr:DUF4386 family protein [Archangium minus]